MLSRYDAVLSTLNAGVVIHGADTVILDANSRARSLLGIQDLEGRLASDPQWVFLESDHSPMALERFPVMQVIATMEPVREMTAIIQPPQRPEVWLEISALPILDEAGQLDQVVVTFIETTGRKRAESMLEEQANRLAASEERLRAVLDSSGDSVLRMSPDGRIEFVNRQVELNTGVPLDRWIGKTFEEMGYGLFAESWNAYNHQVFETGRPVSFEFEINDARGHRWYATLITPEVDATGSVTHVIQTSRDVTAAHIAAEVLAAAEEESRLAFDRSRVATCLVSNDGRITRVNPAICDLLGRSAAELLTLGFLDVTHPDDVGVGTDEIRDLMSGRQSSLRLTKRYVAGNGRVIWGDVTVSAVRNSDGTVRHRIAQILDVTLEHALQASLMEAERIAHLGAWQLDLATGTVAWSRELYEMCGLDPAGPVPDIANQPRLFTPESWERLSAAIAHTREEGTPYTLELEMVRPDGTLLWVEARGEAVRDAGGAIVGLHGVTLNISDRKAASDRLQELATHDSLTGLANRAALLDEISRAVSAGRRAGRSTAILMMDLDRFKEVNDTLGHAAGDSLLVAAAARLKEDVRAGDLVARLGGDEFVVVMRDLDDPTESMRAAMRLVQNFRVPFTLDGRELFATASVGVAVATEDAGAGDLLREADTAMYSAKEEGRDRASMFNEDLRTAVTDRLAVEADLRHALERGELEVWYQPEVDLSSGAVIALEALLRWRHPDGTVWTADRFVGIAEDTGLILDIGDWVFRMACTQAAAWAAARPGNPIKVRVNVSALQLTEAGLLAAIDAALVASGVDPRLLCLEITETALLRRTSTVTANLEAIHARGISMAVDDFGTGYASLTYLNQYTFDLIKIDRSFVSAAPPSRGHALIEGIIALAKTLDIGVTAEGVEQLDQAASLHQMGCPSAQGWLYSPAVPPEAVSSLLDRVYPHP